jgi:lysophospholipase L1-like esterase
MKIHPKSTLLMIGDSITDCGRAYPVAEGPGEALGTGYVSLVNACLTAAHPGAGFRVINMGVNGNTVRDLAARWDRDVLALKPDWLSIMIGINDVWRHFDAWPGWGSSIDLDEYSQTLDRLIRKTQPHLKGLVLMTPYLIEPDRADPIRARMDEFGAAVRELVGRHQAVLVDTQAAFDEVLNELDPFSLAEDRVHPNLSGHMILARAFLKAIECNW